MKYRVKVKTTVTAWLEVEAVSTAVTKAEVAHWATRGGGQFQLDDRLAGAGLERGPVELAHEELDESVQEIQP